MTEPPNKERKFYSRTYYPLEYPTDGSSIRQSSTPEAIGYWYRGIEFVQVVRGRKVTMVLLQGGQVEPLSELVSSPYPRSEKQEALRRRVLHWKEPPLSE